MMDFTTVEEKAILERNISYTRHQDQAEVWEEVLYIKRGVVRIPLRIQIQVNLK